MSAYTVRETAAYYALRVERVRDEAKANGWKLTLPHVVTFDSLMEFLERIARDDLAIFAPDDSGSTDLQPRVGSQ